MTVRARVRPITHAAPVGARMPDRVVRMSAGVAGVIAMPT
jgi:hypothetical protein